MVAGLRLEQAAEERGQLGVGEPVAEKCEAFARACLDQPRDQEAIDRPGRLLLADEGVQFRPVTARRQLAERNAAPLAQGQHHLEMLQLLADDLGQGPKNRHAVDIGENEVHRHARGLLLAVGVVDDQFFEVLLHLHEPAIGCWRG